MKLAAIILSVCMLAYFADFSLSIHMCRIVEETTVSEKSSCSNSEAEDEPCSPGTDDCADYCFNCPLTYVATLATAFYFQQHYLIQQTRFDAYAFHYKDEFFTTAWKPPNFSFSYNAQKFYHS